MADQKRVFKTKTFDRWAKKLLSDDILCRLKFDPIIGSEIL